MAADLLFFQWCTGMLLVSALLWAGAFAVLAFRERPRYRRNR